MKKTNIYKTYLFYFLVPLLVGAFLLISFLIQPKINYDDYEVTSELIDYTVYQKVPSLKAMDKSQNILYLGNSYISFKEAVAFKESQGNYSAVNTLGYLGKYQFGVTTLDLLGINKPNLFLKTPVLQEKAFLANVKRNKWVLRRDIKRFVGKKIEGIRITESGILAAAHLAGPGSVKRYLRTYGAFDVSDTFGTDIPSYMYKFSGYDMSFVSPHRTPKISEP